MLFEKKVVSKLAIRSLARVVFQKWTDDTFEISYRRQHGSLNLGFVVSATPNPRALGKLAQYNLGGLFTIMRRRKMKLLHEI